MKMQSMRQLRSIGSLRNISIALSSTSLVPPIPNQPLDVNDVKASETLPDQHALESAIFKALGNPPSVLSINSPPSVPVYVRRGSLLSIYGFRQISSPSVLSSLEIISPFKRYLYGRIPSSYQRLTATSPFSILVSAIARNFSIFGNPEDKTFASIHLNGFRDWAIINKDALQAYTGNSLNITLHTFPKTISSKLAKTFKIPGRTLTGLFKWNNAGYTLLSGRGDVGIVGSGSVYNIDVSQNEEIIISRKNLLAIEVNGPYDLQNCVIKHNSVIQKDKPVVPIPKVKLEDQVTTNRFLKYLRATGGFLHGITIKTAEIFRRLVLEELDFVKVIGARRLLLQSKTSAAYSIDSQLFSRSQSQKQRTNSSDYLSYVTVKKGERPEFQSTPNFEDTVNKISKR
ncbi:uncharacterized protein PRCAT00002964001 [Priceomyces carsonii]|uniref:uncharacterized protein n=1 Tax=Priceomyces carsonii TaxID=28549 RepID=UPI002EDB4EFE|nr:unnamed protein product [Priceomyces carsonii]